MNASEAYEKYKDMDELAIWAEGVSATSDLWSAIKHEHFGKVIINDVTINGKSIMKEGR